MLAMCDQWLADLEGLMFDGGTVYFPVSFDDQGSVWIASSGEGNGAAMVETGGSTLEGKRSAKLIADGGTLVSTGHPLTPPSAASSRLVRATVLGCST
jgi:hypothetical protein